MCGISGTFAFHGASRPTDVDIVRRMTKAIAHRGPDGEGLWRSPDGCVVLGHRRLAIVDLSPAAAQPMVNEDGMVAITYNGEVYNHAAIRRDVEAKGHCFRSRSDTEAILHLYEERGAAVVEALDGMFAFAIYDGHRREMLLARDRLGKKPLYYVERPDCFVFASEIKALLEHPAVVPRVNPTGLYHYLTYLVVPAPDTMFDGIRKLPAGHVLRVSESGRVMAEPYWEPLPRRVVVPAARRDAAVRERLEEAVAKRLMSDVPVGLLFSGGVDSSLNAALFTRAAGAPVRTFTVGFQDTRLLEDERTTAAGMAAILGADHHEVQIGEREFLDFTDDIARVQDEPIADPVCVPLYFVTRLARATGTPVVHVGEGADETFCGYPRYREALARHRRVWQPLLHVPRPLVDATWRLAAAATSRRGPWAKGADLLRRRALGQEPFLSSAVAFYEIEKPPILAPAFQARCRGLDSFDAIRPHYRRLREMVPDATPLETMTYLELRLRLPELLLMRIDKVAMANSVEARAPFLDYQLVELALSLPESFKLEGGEPKAPLKRLAAQFLPASAIYQRKRGFGAPIQEWFRSLLGDRFRLALTAHREGLSQYFDVDELLARSRGPVPRVNDAFQLWTVFNFVKWYERFIA